VVVISLTSQLRFEPGHHQRHLAIAVVAPQQALA